MTAREIVESLNNEWIDPNKDMENAIKEYARKKCEEQRHIVSKQLFNKWDEDICQIARLSPEPEIK